MEKSPRITLEIPQIILLSGSSGSGKTSVCQAVCSRIRAKNLQLGGLITPAVFDQELKTGIDVQNLKTDERCLFAAKTPFKKGTSIGQWYLSQEGLSLGKQAIMQAFPCDILVIDEIGPLELFRKEGWFSAIPLLQQEKYQCAIVTVRPSLAADLRNLLQIREPIVLQIDPTNRQLQITHILQLWKFL